jgi:hypothetical protein
MSLAVDPVLIQPHYPVLPFVHELGHRPGVAGSLSLDDLKWQRTSAPHGAVDASASLLWRLHTLHLDRQPGPERTAIAADSAFGGAAVAQARRRRFDEASRSAARGDRRPARGGYVGITGGQRAQRSELDVGRLLGPDPEIVGRDRGSSVPGERSNAKQDSRPPVEQFRG